MLELSHSGNRLEFSLGVNQELHINMNKVLNAYLDGIGFLLDIPFYSTTSKSELMADFEISQGQPNALISFEYIILKDEYDKARGYYGSKEITKAKAINRLEIEEFISRLFTNERLGDAVYHYLKAVEEPESFLVSLYRAYERIREFKVFSKKQASDFGKLANHEPIWGSRHSGEEQHAEVRYLTKEEREFCLETIKAGIIKYSGSIPVS